MKLPYKKEDLLDVMKRPLTQGLFLETSQYNEDRAIFTLKENDHVYKGKTFYSLKQYYLQHEDPTEYDFAMTYLYSWDQWKRIKANKLITPYIEEWEEELELRLRAQAIRGIIDMTVEDNSFQSKKWLADRGWEKRGAGRPSKQDQLKEARMQDRLEEEFSNDVVRLLGTDNAN